MPALRLDVLSLVPVLYKQCAHCQTIYGQADMGETMQSEQLREYPADILEDHLRLSDWVRELASRYAGADIRVVDPQSLAGIWMTLRHRVRQYPTFIINGRDKCSGWDREALERAIQRNLRES